VHTDKREQIRQTLKCLVEAQASTIALTEKALSLLNDELALDPLTFWKARRTPSHSETSQTRPIVDEDRLEIRYRSHSCFIGNKLPFRLFARLLHQPNKYISYEELLDDVWDGRRLTDSAVRNAVKRLRAALRGGGMAELADAIDGSEPGRYALLLAN